MNSNLHKHLVHLGSTNRATVVKSIRYLGLHDEKIAVPRLLELLRHEDNLIRNAAAVALRRMKRNEAVSIIIELIRNPRNKNSCGTLLYALQTLDARKAFLDMVKMVGQGNYEERQMSLMALEKMKPVSKRLVEEARKLLIEFVKNSHASHEKCGDYVQLTTILKRQLGKGTRFKN